MNNKECIAKTTTIYNDETSANVNYYRAMEDPDAYLRETLVAYLHWHIIQYRT